jgi:peptidyl-prolyl cis-trans isomerase C
MKPDEISDVFLTGFGYHIVKVYDKREPGIAPFAETKDYIAAHLHEEKKSKTLEDYLDKLKANADIQR